MQIKRATSTIILTLNYDLKFLLFRNHLIFRLIEPFSEEYFFKSFSVIYVLQKIQSFTSFEGSLLKN